MSHSTDSHKYCEDVASGKKLACKLTRQACERQLSDLKKQKSEDFPYYFDSTAADRMCNFIEKLPHIKGEWARKKLKIKLEPWQKFVICTVFGWLSKVTGTRRFRTAYIEVPRKNAKSTLSSGVGLAMQIIDNEAGAEIYSAATTKDQAKIVFTDAQQMARKSPALLSKFGVKVQAHNINVLKTASKFEALSADGSTLDGLNTHFACLDELHAHKTRSLFDVMETSTGARLQSLLWLITTAGFNRVGICYEQRTYVTKILDKVTEDETYFGCIWTIDDDDDWTDPSIWEKANPNYDVSVYPDNIANLCRKAMEMPSATNNFLTKRLNLWVNADQAWMDMRKWDQCADSSLDLDNFAGKDVFISLDLASKLDMNAKIILHYDEKEDMYSLFGKYYLPEDVLETSANSQYSGWAREGRLCLTPGNVIDLDYIEEDLRTDMATYDVVEIPYDPFQATQLSVHMINEGMPMVEMRPTVLNFSEPMKERETGLFRETTA